MIRYIKFCPDTVAVNVMYRMLKLKTVQTLACNSCAVSRRASTADHVQETKLLAQSRDRTLVPPHNGATFGCRSGTLGWQGSNRVCFPRSPTHLQACTRQGKVQNFLSSQNENYLWNNILRSSCFVMNQDNCGCGSRSCRKTCMIRSFRGDSQSPNGTLKS